MSNHRLRRLAVVGAATAAALTLGACSTPASDDPTGAASADTAAPQSGGTLRVNYWPDNVAFPCVDPFQTYWIESRSIIRNFADSLTDQDPKTGDIVPWLASSWKISDDGLTYTFTLRDGATFSDGTPVNAAAVKANFDGFQKTLADNPYAFGGVYIAGLKSTDAPDDTTVVFHLSTPNAAFLQATSTTNLAILAPSVFQESASDRCLGKDLVGSGPFVLTSYTPNEKTVLTKRTGYAWPSELNANKGDAYLDGIEFSYVAEDSVRTGNLVSGASDVAWPRNPFSEEDRNLITTSGYQLASRSLPGPANDYYLNATQGRPLSDINVRKALTKGVDRATYASTIYGADYPVVEGVYDTTTPYAVSHSKDLAYDPDGAKQLLEDAGWKVGADGIREKDGKKLTLIYPIAGSNPGAELLQAQLKAIGIDLKLSVIQPADRAAVITDGKYDIVENYFTRADPGVLQWILDPNVAGSKALAENTQSAEQVAKVQDLFTQGLVASKPDDRANVYAELQQYLLDQVITVPLNERVQYAGLGKSVHGFQFTSEAFANYYDTWLDK